MPISSMSLGEIASLLGGELRGDPSVEVTGIAPIDQAGPRDLAFISNRKYIRSLSSTQAAGVLVSPDVARLGAPEGTGLVVLDDPYMGFARLVVLDDPYMGFARLLQHWTYEPRRLIGVSERAYVDPAAKLGAEVNVHPLAYVGPGATIGDRVDLHPGSYVGPGATIGADTVLGPNAVVHHGCKVGARCHIYAGAVIGSDGFGFAPDLRTGLHAKIPQIGIAVIEDDVEIGANTTIDRAAMGETRVGRGTKIDNLVQIGHNARVGGGCFVVAQAGISGTARVGNGVTIAGQAGIAGHLQVGDGAVIGAQAGVHSDVGPGERMLGTPAVPGNEAKRYMAVITSLPEMKRRLRQLEKRVDGEA